MMCRSVFCCWLPRMLQKELLDKRKMQTPAHVFLQIQGGIFLCVAFANIPTGNAWSLCSVISCRMSSMELFVLQKIVCGCWHPQTVTVHFTWNEQLFFSYKTWMQLVLLVAVEVRKGLFLDEKLPVRETWDCSLLWHDQTRLCVCAEVCPVAHMN